MNPEEGKRIGVYLCSERGEISNRIDLDSVADYMRQFDDVIDVGIHNELSSKEGLDFLLAKYEELRFDRLLIGGAVPAIQGAAMQHELASTGLNKYLFYMVNLREQCAWVTPDKEEATRKAKSIMLAGLEKLRRLEPLEDLDVPVKNSVLVIGGGVAGMAAALQVARAGFKVYLVEKEHMLGGRAYQLDTTYPTHNCGICCMAYCKECVFTPKIEDIERESNIELLLNSEVDQISGGFGNRHVSVKRKGEKITFDVGIVIVAIGTKTFDPAKITQYRYHDSMDIVTSMDFVKLMRGAQRTGLTRPSDGRRVKTVNIALCVGSRCKVHGNTNCSLVCCTYAIGTAKEIKKLMPETQVYIHYIDLRGPYRGFEEFSNEARAMGIQFVRGKVGEILVEPDHLLVRAEDADTGIVLGIKSDLVILAVGQEPSVGSLALARMLHIQVDSDNFMKDVNPMLPADIRRGIYIVGCAQGPKGIRYSIDDAMSAANEAINVLRAGHVAIERTVASVNEDRCRGCGRCAEACVFRAVEVVEKNGRRVAQVNELLCEGCGVCAVTCCNKSIDIMSHRASQITPMIRSLIMEME